MEPRGLELLAPARDVETARIAIIHGADAVYIGGPSHGARASASNSINEIADLTDFAHLYGAKVYVTLNTIIYDDELSKVEGDIHELYKAGVDALIVQDMSLLRMTIPPIDLHASTQCDIRTPEKAKFLSHCGFSQLVLPRELSLDEIKAIREAVDQSVALEAFVHGALCVSYSGDCQASCLANGRSANRGECAQMCRLPYSLTDADGNVLIKDKHLLSLRDLNRLPDIGALADSGISSFKIEGRLKDASYVKNTVAAYRQAIDRVISDNPDRYFRTSYGSTILSFTPDVNKSFNRGFTSYFTHGRPLKYVSMANIHTPKWVGEPVGKIKSVKGNTLIAKIDAELHNGDGLGYFTESGQFTGFRLNRVEGDKLYPASHIDIAPDTIIYRNRDVKTDALMAQDTAKRLMGIDMTLSLDSERLTLQVSAESGVGITVTESINVDEARQPQIEARRRALSKLGGSPYCLSNLYDNVDPLAFIPLSALTSLRQRAIKALTDQLISSHHRLVRRAEDMEAQIPNPRLTYHDNVANDLAENFYRSHGAIEIQRPLETGDISQQKELTVMTTRYCLRRELGACLRTADAKKLPSPLFITNAAATYQLDFDCANCQMRLKTRKG